MFIRSSIEGEEKNRADQVAGLYPEKNYDQRNVHG